ncbi:hypothetical protein ACQP3F_32125, partial [Escherichia coli]
MSNVIWSVALLTFKPSTPPEAEAGGSVSVSLRPAWSIEEFQDSQDYNVSKRKRKRKMQCLVLFGSFFVFCFF